MDGMSSGEEDEWLQSIEEESDDEAAAHLKSWLLPQTQGFFEAPSGHRLHVRAVLPSGDASARTVKASIMYCHGLNSHVNSRGWAGGFYPRLAQEGFAIFAVDIMGHGYSEGERALIEDWDVVFEDLEHFTEALMGVAEDPPEKEDFNAGVSDEVLKNLRRLPFFVVGTSLGGMISMYVGHRLDGNERLQGRFRGAVLGCPALLVDLPPKAVQVLLRNLVVPLFKTSAMPTFISKSSKGQLGSSFNLSDPTQKEMAEMEIRDCAKRLPGVGLGWHDQMKWGTAGAFSKIYAQIEEDMEDVDFPFLIIHDPEDSVTLFAGSEKLMALSPSEDKTLHAMHAGGLHCLPLVEQETYVSIMTSWMKQRL